MEENKQKKIIKIVLLIALCLIALSLAFFALSPEFKKKTILTPKETGAIQSSPTQEEIASYEQLYNLLDKGEISTDYFKIQPVSKQRKINILVKKPLDVNKEKAIQWLKENGYGSIPEKNLFFYESFD